MFTKFSIALCCIVALPFVAISIGQQGDGGQSPAAASQDILSTTGTATQDNGTELAPLVTQPRASSLIQDRYFGLTSTSKADREIDAAASPCNRPVPSKNVKKRRRS